MTNETDDQDRDEVNREPGEGESYDANGNIRPVPGGVPDQPEEDRDDEQLVTDGGEVEATETSRYCASCEQYLTMAERKSGQRCVTCRGVTA